MFLSEGKVRAVECGSHSESLMIRVVLVVTMVMVFLWTSSIVYEQSRVSKMDTTAYALPMCISDIDSHCEASIGTDFQSHVEQVSCLLSNSVSLTCRITLDSFPIFSCSADGVNLCSSTVSATELVECLVIHKNEITSPTCGDFIEALPVAQCMGKDASTCMVNDTTDTVSSHGLYPSQISFSWSATLHILIPIVVFVFVSVILLEGLRLIYLHYSTAKDTSEGSHYISVPESEFRYV